jgi:hypothetical protein
MKVARFFAMLLALVLLSSSADAKTKDGVTMADTVSVGGKTLVLNGLGTRKATVLVIGRVKVYVAGLYLEAKEKNGQTILNSTTAKRLVLKFVRDVEKDKVTNAWDEGFQRNVPGQVGALKPKIDQLNSWMADMKEGESMSFTYQNGSLEVNVKGTSKGSIQGADFAKAFFSIWLDKPPNSGLKEGLLEG